MKRFHVSTTASGLNIFDPWSGTETTTTAPAGIVLRIAESKEAENPAWRACDLAGFAEMRASRFVPPAQLIDNGRTFKPVTQPDLFARL